MSERTDKLHNQTILIMWLFLPDLYRSNLALYWLPLQSRKLPCQHYLTLRANFTKKISFMVNMSYSIVCNVFFYPWWHHQTLKIPKVTFQIYWRFWRSAGPLCSGENVILGIHGSSPEWPESTLFWKQYKPPITSRYLSVSKIPVTLQSRNPHAWPCRGAALKKV